MAQFPTNNYDSTHGGVDENNNPNTPEIANANKGKERTGNALYSDKHYLDGDGFLYGLGMASQRMIVKGKTTDIDTSCFFWNGGGTNAKLELNMPSIASYLAGKGFYASAGKLNLMFYTKRNGNINESGLIVPENSDSHVSGLKINYGPGLMLNSNGQLVVDSAAVVPNISGTNPIKVTTSGNNKAIGLKLRPTADGVYSWSGLKVYDTADNDGGIGLSIDINRSSHGDNPLDIDTGGLFVDWERMLSNFASNSGGNLNYYTDGNGHFGISVVAGNGLKNNPQSKHLEVLPKPNLGIGVDSNGVYLKVASTSEIGGVKLGTSTAPEVGMNSSTHYLLKDGSDVAYVNAYVYNSYPTTNAAEHYPYSAAYIISNYSTKTEVTAEIASAVSDISGREYKIFTDWPAPPTNPTKEQWDEFYATYKKYIALKSTGGTDPDAYEERILIRTNESTGECRWEKIGDTKFTTDNFVAKTDVLTQAEVASIVQDVFGF